MSIPLTERTQHHFQGFSADSEKHIHNLRLDANKEVKLRKDLSARSQAAYARGDKEQAHQLSVQSKVHAANADRLFQESSDYAFRDRNGQDRPGDEIDLHGQTVQQAEVILLARITAEKNRHASHLRVITGQGFHSVDHDPKIKPAIEKLLSERGFQFHVEEHNAGRIYVDLRGDQDLSYQAPPAGHGQGYQRPPGQQHGGGPQNTPYEQDSPQKTLTDAISKCVACCVVM